MVHISKTTKVTTSVQENFFIYWEKSTKWYQYLYNCPKSKIVVRTGPAQWSKLRQEHKKWFLWLHWSKVVRKRVVATFSDVNTLNYCSSAEKWWKMACFGVRPTCPDHIQEVKNGSNCLSNLVFSKHIRENTFQWAVLHQNWIKCHFPI